MDSAIRGAAELFAVADDLVPKALEGLDRAQLLHRPGPESNPMIWLWGHLTNTRCGLLSLLGIEHPRFHNDLFGLGSEIVSDDAYPSAEEIQAAWDDVTAKLEARFESITDAELSQPSPRQFRVADTTLRGSIWFLAWHEGTHVGQMGYLKKWLGQGRLTR
ncbi:MAG: DUF664 domain-containing protein [Acidobacteria bacterium]|nr:DUF664 domain-containing protein [Acidobacteriota bacterium]